MNTSQCSAKITLAVDATWTSIWQNVQDTAPLHAVVLMRCVPVCAWCRSLSSLVWYEDVSYNKPELDWVTGVWCRRIAAVKQLASFTAFNWQFCTVQETAGDIAVHYQVTAGDISVHYQETAEDISVHYQETAGDISVHYQETAGDISVHYQETAEDISVH